MTRTVRPSVAFAPFALVVLLMAAAPAAADDDSDDDSDDERTMAVEFDELDVFKKRSRLHVDFTVGSESWERLEEKKIALWFQLEIPTRSRYPNDVISYTMQVQERSGTTTFPDWLDTSGVSRVDLCMLGTGPNDNLGFGRGWTCADKLGFDLDGHATRGPTERRTVTLVYRKRTTSLPHAPWSSPVPPNMPSPY